MFGNTPNYVLYYETHQKIEFEMQFLYVFLIEFRKTLFVFALQKYFFQNLFFFIFFFTSN